MAIVAGFFVPLCDCAVVPVASRLIKKGVPASAAICFMLASPIVNPITLVATYFAFPGQPKITLYRVILGILIALSVGLIVGLLYKDNEMVLKNITDTEVKCNCHECNSYVTKTEKKLFNKLCDVLVHAAEEFFTVGKYFTVGAAISSFVQLTFPKESIVAIAKYPVISILIMISIAFFMSICSTADAFIARSFSNSVPMQGVMSFMVLGPLLDIKNVLMMFGCFSKKFVILLSVSIAVIGFCILYTFTNIIF
jgi:uncharacterized membrane protein YraQ (UPF0718 family)